MNPENQSPKQAPRSIKLVAGLVLVEALAPFGLAAWAGVALISGSARSVPTLLAELVFFLAAGAWLANVSRRLMQGASSARSAAVFWQLVQLAVASASFSGEFANPVIGVSLIVSSLVVGVFLFSRDSIAWIAEKSS
jgi:hypothetical protein